MAGNFYRVACPDCENEQIVFGKAASEVACQVCGHTLARPTGGEAVIEGEVVETVEHRGSGGQTQSGGTIGAQ